MSEKAVIGFPRLTSRATFSGGSWAAAYPVGNLGILPLAQVARSTNLAAASTIFTATFDRESMVRMLGLVRHNLSTEAKIRIRIFEDVAKTILLADTGTVDVWPEVYPPSELEWEADNFWSGRYSAEEMADYAPTRPFLFEDLYLCRAIEVAITDPTNPAGYVEMGLFEVATGWQVGANYDFGAEYGFRFRSEMTEALGGVRYFERRDKPRVFSGSISYLRRDEALGRGFEMLRRHDIDEPFLWLPNPAEPLHWLRLCFLARNVNPGLLASTFVGRERFPISLEEVL